MDSRTKLIHHAAATAANVHDSVILEDLLHGEETRVWGDSAYAGKKAVLAEHAPDAKDFTQKRAHRHRPLSDEDRARNRNKSRIRSRVEHVFGVMRGSSASRKSATEAWPRTPIICLSLVRL